MVVAPLDDVPRNTGDGETRTVGHDGSPYPVVIRLFMLSKLRKPWSVPEVC